ncbi:2-dehydro-3-deoxyphosphooctonate aldolase-like isoform X2 [Camellia sinensis]|uniref:2-dehydro-3-deoxyphosphooctonate aldolase-like isoform X2 n=1 Tax=Camellia sinensis TaxID=4442 RepID=UPI00103623DB|nr:2-dehydro-3-deoxyphosphooctonate aldolase-like isoform X2 [Camellia sinensis]
MPSQWWMMLEGGGVASGGLRELIPCIARTAVAVGVDGISMEVHDDPRNAPVDGPTQWPLRHLEELLEELIAIAEKLNFRLWISLQSRSLSVRAISLCDLNLCIQYILEGTLQGTFSCSNIKRWQSRHVSFGFCDC